MQWNSAYFLKRHFVIMGIDVSNVQLIAIIKSTKVCWHTLYKQVPPSGAERMHQLDIYVLLAHMLGIRPETNDGRPDAVRHLLARPETLPLPGGGAMLSRLSYILVALTLLISAYQSAAKLGWSGASD